MKDKLVNNLKRKPTQDSTVGTLRGMSSKSGDDRHIEVRGKGQGTEVLNDSSSPMQRRSMHQVNTHKVTTLRLRYCETNGC